MIELVKKASNVELTTPIIVTGSGGSADLSNYYNKQEVDDKIAAIKIPDLAGYATEEYVQQQIDNIPAPDLSGYALKSEIPDVSGFLTEIPSEYVTESELDAKGYLTNYTESDPIYTADKPNIALKSEIPTVPTKVSAFTNDAGYLTEHQDLSNYALKTEIPDVSGYQTEAQVNALINTALGVIENGTY